MTNALVDIQIEAWQPDRPVAPLDRELDMLAEVLHAVVHDGAGVSFIVPFSIDEARAFWVDKVLPGVRARTRHVAVARSGARIVGTVQVDVAVPPNQRHRAEVVKLLVHPVARRRGIARALMIAIESIAQSEGRTLLTLDTWTGGVAEALYRSLGYTAAGVIPRYARGSLTPELQATTIMYKELPPAERPSCSGAHVSSGVVPHLTAVDAGRGRTRSIHDLPRQPHPRAAGLTHCHEAWRGTLVAKSGAHSS